MMIKYSFYFLILFCTKLILNVLAIGVSGDSKKTEWKKKKIQKNVGFMCFFNSLQR